MELFVCYPLCCHEDLYRAYFNSVVYVYGIFMHCWTNITGSSNALSYSQITFSLSFEKLCT